MCKLELKYVAPYLPYVLKVQWTDHGYTTEKKITGAGENHVTFDVSEDEEFEETTTSLTILYFDAIKPILRPLSDLTKEIPMKHGLGEFCPMDALKQLQKESGEECFVFFDDLAKTPLEYSYWVVNHLIEWHFDVFGLIEKGLAIDINTIEDFDKLSNTF